MATNDGTHEPGSDTTPNEARVIVTGLWHGPLAWTTAAAPVAPTAPVVPVVPARGRAGGERNGTLFLGKGDIFSYSFNF